MKSPTDDELRDMYALAMASPGNSLRTFFNASVKMSLQHVDANVIRAKFDSFGSGYGEDSFPQYSLVQYVVADRLRDLTTEPVDPTESIIEKHSQRLWNNSGCTNSQIMHDLVAEVREMDAKKAGKQ